MTCKISFLKNLSLSLFRAPLERVYSCCSAPKKSFEHLSSVKWFTVCTHFWHLSDWENSYWKGFQVNPAICPLCLAITQPPTMINHIVSLCFQQDANQCINYCISVYYNSIQ
jgi:hypothetical protein